MKNIIYISLISVILISCGPVQTVMDYDRQANFSNYKTYSFYQPGLDSLKVNDLDKKRIIQAIESNMNAKGLQKTDSGNLIINVKASSKQQVDINNDMNFGWGYSWYGPWVGMTNTWVTEREVGKIVIDMVDGNTKTLVWQGIGSGLNLNRVAEKEELIGKSIGLILANYPPKSNQ